MTVLKESLSLHTERVDRHGGADESRPLWKGVASMRRILLVFAVAALLAAMVVIMALPAFAAGSQKYCFAAQRSADASGRTGLINPPFTTEGSYLSERQGSNATFDSHKCF